MAAAPNRIREVRYLNGTSLNTTFTAASNAAWAAGTATKLRVIDDVDQSSLEYPSEPDPTLESQLYRARAHIPTIRTGSVKFSMFLEGAESDTSANPVATLLSHIMGGIQNPNSARTDAAEASGSSTVVKMTTHSSETGTAILVGTRGDSKGGAEVRVVTDTNANAVTATMAFPGTPATSDAVVNSTTVFFDDATQQYIDGLVIGKSTEDQWQWLGGMGPFSLEGLNPGEIPKVGFDLSVVDHQIVPAADRDQLEPTSATQGNQPALNRGIGGCFIQDNGTTTRAAFKIADLVINPNVTFQPIPDPNGVNGLGGWQRVPSEPTFEFTAILEGGADPFGWVADFENGATSTGMQAKQLLFQFGHTAQRCVAIDFPKAYFDARPTRVEAGGLAAVRVVGHGEFGTTGTALADSGMRIHFF